MARIRGHVTVVTVVLDGLSPEEREECLRAMQAASNAFYAAATRCGNHAFIEFTGLMNEYIQLCWEAHRNGIDFTRASVHSRKQSTCINCGEPFETGHEGVTLLSWSLRRSC
jgi:hypothetical protein